MTQTHGSGTNFTGDADTQAVIPQFSPLTPDPKRQAKAVGEVRQAGSVSHADKAVGSLIYNDGWKEVEEFIKTLVSDLEHSVAVAIDSKMSLEQIGERAMIAKLTREELQKVLNYVYARAERLKATST